MTEPAPLFQVDGASQPVNQTSFEELARLLGQRSGQGAPRPEPDKRSPAILESA